MHKTRFCLVKISQKYIATFFISYWEHMRIIHTYIISLSLSLSLSLSQTCDDWKITVIRKRKNLWTWKEKKIASRKIYHNFFFTLHARIKMNSYHFLFLIFSLFLFFSFPFSFFFYLFLASHASKLVIYFFLFFFSLLLSLLKD